MYVKLGLKVTVMNNVVLVSKKKKKNEWSCVLKGRIAKDFGAMTGDLVPKVMFENEI